MTCTLYIERSTFLNTSDYVPVKALVNIEYSERSRDQAPVIKVKPKWDKCDRTQKMQDAMKRSRLIWWELRNAGEREDPGHPARKRMIVAKQTLRKVQRLEPAKQRNARVEDILSSDALPKLSSSSSTNNENPLMLNYKA